MDINVQGIMRCTKAVLGHFMERKYGKIVNTASGAGRGPIWWGPPKGLAMMSSPYGPSKAAVINYTQSVAASVAEYNINVNAICPGQVWTAFHEPSILALKNADAFREGLSRTVRRERPRPHPARQRADSGGDRQPCRVPGIRRRQFHHRPVDSHRRRTEDDLTTCS